MLRHQNMNNIKEKLDLILNNNNDGKKVLIVDDSLYVHYYLGSYFTELGFKVVGFAKDGKEGIEAYFKLKPDLITLDNTMPLMSGIEAAEELYKKDKSVRILFISAVGGSKNFHLTVKNIIPQHNYRILEKPIEKTEIKEILNNFI